MSIAIKMQSSVMYVFNDVWWRDVKIQGEIMQNEVKFFVHLVGKFPRMALYLSAVLSIKNQAQERFSPLTWLDIGYRLKLP